MTFYKHVLFFIVCLFSTSFSIESREMEKKEIEVDNARHFQKSRKINGLIFIGDIKDVEKKADKYGQGIWVEDLFVPKPKNFEKIMKSFVGKPLSDRTIEEIRARINEYYYNNQFSVVSVIIPGGQDITNGYVQVLVMVGKAGKIEAEGGKYNSHNKIVSKIRTKPGAFIQTTPMQEDIMRLNQSPFRDVTIFYKPGAKTGETDITLHVEDRFPLRVYGQYENSGYQAAGDSRYMAGFNLGNLFGLDHQLDGQFLSASSAHDLWALSGSYWAPLPWRHELKVYGNYVHLVPSTRTFNLTDNFDVNGHSWQVIGRYEIPLPRMGRYRHNITIGYDFKRTNNFLAFSADQLFNNNVDFSKFLLNYEGVIDDNVGGTSFGGTLFVSPGGMTKYNKNQCFEIERSGACANYIYFFVNLQRVWFLPWKFSWVMTGLFQYSSGKLLPSDQLSLGGMNSVRGYNENEVTGDRGLLWRNDFFFPTWTIYKKPKFQTDFKFLGFVDMGFTNNADQNIVSKESAILFSIGPGARLSVGQYFNARADYGFQLVNISDRYYPKGGHSRLHLIITLSI